MRHNTNKRKFGREKNERNALIRSLACNLIRLGRIRTTLPKAKELRPFVEKLITKARTVTVASRRLVMTKIHNAMETKKLFDTVAPKFIKRRGGYTRIIKLPNRDHDGSPMALIEFVE